jgi:predicted anti-sigma-YlaC factor YlaD
LSPCAAIRTALDEWLDLAPGSAAAAEVDAHLRHCADCREVADGLLQVRRVLREIPPAPLPRPALDLVLERTVRAQVRRPDRPAAGFGWLAAVAATVLALAFLPWLLRPAPEARSAAELEHAERDAARVLALAADAIHRGEHAVVRGVLLRHVSPAVGKVPLRRPDWAQPRRSAT